MFRRLTPLQLSVDIGLGTLAVLLRLVLPSDPWPFPLAVVALGAAFALHRVSPPLALAVAWLGAVLQMSAGIGPDVSDVAILVVLYSTARHGTRLTRWLGFASAIVGAVVAAVFLVLAPVGGGASVVITSPAHVGLQFTALCVASLAVLTLSWTVGLLARNIDLSRQARRTQAEAERVAVVEQERNRIAREMHDVVAHSLAVVIAQADGARYAGAADPAVAEAALGTIAATAREALADVRLLLGELRQDSGAGPQPTLADLPALVAQVRASGLAVDLEADGDAVAHAAPSLQLATFRVVQEALTNALRHGAPASPVSVRIARRDGALEATVTSALRAGDAPRVVAGHGLTGMRERALLVGGVLETSAEDGSFVVRMRVPHRSEARA